MDFLIDTRATYSTVNRPLSPCGRLYCDVISGIPKSHFFLKPLEHAMRHTILTHKFLYIPECAIPLLGRDLLFKLPAQIIFPLEEQQLYLQVPPEHAWQFLMKPWDEGEKLEEIENQANHIVWAAGKLGRAK